VNKRSGDTKVINNYEKTTVVVDGSILNPELYDLQNEKNRVVTDETIDRVISKLKELKKAPERDIVSLIKIAEAYLEVKDYENALQYFNQVLEIEPQNSDGIWGRATVAYYLEDFKLSLDDFTHYLTIFQDNSVAYYNRGLLYANLRKTDFALRDYGKAIEINPNYADAYNNRGNLYKNLGKTDFALRDWTKAIEINPNLASAYNNRAVLYGIQGDLKKAKADAIRTIELGFDSGLMNYMKQNGMW
jgi:tetratricopeptide (TPR) repeat protein